MALLWAHIHSWVGSVWGPSRSCAVCSALSCFLWMQAWSSKGHVRPREPQHRLGFTNSLWDTLQHQTGSALLVPLPSDFLNPRPCSVLEPLQQQTLRYLTRHLWSCQAMGYCCSPSLLLTQQTKHSFSFQLYPKLYRGTGTTAKWTSLREHLE